MLFAVGKGPGCNNGLGNGPGKDGDGDGEAGLELLPVTDVPVFKRAGTCFTGNAVGGGGGGAAVAPVRASHMDAVADVAPCAGIGQTAGHAARVDGSHFSSTEAFGMTTLHGDG